MSASGKSNTPQGKKDRREIARETARLEREAAKKRQRRNRAFLQGGIGLGVLAVIAIVALVIVSSSAPGSPGPKNMASGGIVLVGKSGAITPVTTAAAPASGAIAPTTSSTGNGVAKIVMYEDWACPACKSFEATYANAIAALVSSGRATLEIHPIAILDKNYAGSRYSSRAANVAACVANYLPAKFLDAQNAFYQNQPAEGTPGLTDAAMISLLKGAGIADPTVSACVTKESFTGWVAQVTKVTTSTPALLNPTSGTFGTPTLFVNNKRWDNSSNFMTFLSQSAAGSTPSATPTPTPTPTK